MKQILKFTPEQSELITTMGTIILEGDTKYYNIPNWFIKTADLQDCVFEVFFPEDMPDWFKVEHLNLPIEVKKYRDLLGKHITYKGVQCMITGIPQWYIKEFRLTPTHSNFDIGSGCGMSVSISINNFELLQEKQNG